MASDSAWSEMLDEFRALGGVAENIRLAEGAFGRGLFPIDPTKPVNISIPEDLLVSLDDVVIENNAFCLSATSTISTRGRAFLEQYEQDFSWGPGRLDVERFLAAMNELPEQIRDLLSERFDLALIFEPVVPTVVKAWFFGARVINSRDRSPVIMPIIEMANHGGTASYDLSSSVALGGMFEGEVLVRYSIPTDPLQMFSNWMFAPREPIAFSSKMITTGAGKRFEIRRDFRDKSAPFVPNVTIQEERIVLDYLLLGHQQFPRVPKGAFRRAMQQVKLDDADEVYDFIQFANRQEFLDLLDALEGIDLSIVPTLRTLASNQLRALSCHFGVRPV